MELSTTETNSKRYGSKYFRIFLPQIYQEQSDFLLFARKSLQKNKIRFSLNEFSMSKWNNPAYSGKLIYSTIADNTKTKTTSMSNNKTRRHFKLIVPKISSIKVQFEIQKAERKKQILLQMNEDSFTLKNILENLLGKTKKSKSISSMTIGSTTNSTSNDTTTTREKKYHSLIQQFINPIVEMKCMKTNDTILRIEKEGVSIRLSCLTDVRTN
jgi:hypothetical protein